MIEYKRVKTINELNRIIEILQQEITNIPENNILEPMILKLQKEQEKRRKNITKHQLGVEKIKKDGQHSGQYSWFQNNK